MLETLKAWAHRLERDSRALALAWRDSRTPWYARLVAAAVAAYALSPIDLIPDFIPALGYLDDLILVSAGIALALALVPAEVMAECRERAAADMAGAKRSLVGAFFIVAIWILVALALVWAILARRRLA